MIRQFIGCLDAMQSLQVITLCCLRDYYYTLCLKKCTSGVAQNFKDRFEWHLAEILKTRIDSVYTRFYDMMSTNCMMSSSLHHWY